MTAERERAERADKALELHLAGASYQQIADALGLGSKSTAHDLVKSALADRGAPDAGPVETELARLDALLTALWAKARRGDVQATDRALRIMERQTQLRSVQTAQAAQVKSEDSVEDVQSSVARLLRAVE